MHIRRKVAVSSFQSIKDLLSDWEEKLVDPPQIVLSRDGQGNPIELGNVPEEAMVLETLGEQETIKLRAELAAIAALLEGLAST